jgi:hypothetical protein
MSLMIKSNFGHKRLTVTEQDKNCDAATNPEAHPLQLVGSLVGIPQTCLPALLKSLSVVLQGSLLCKLYRLLLGHALGQSLIDRSNSAVGRRDMDNKLLRFIAILALAFWAEKCELLGDYTNLVVSEMGMLRQLRIRKKPPPIQGRGGPSVHTRQKY